MNRAFWPCCLALLLVGCSRANVGNQTKTSVQAPQISSLELEEENAKKAEVPKSKHPFFELDASVDRDKKEADVFVTTYADSSAVYDLNLPTGKLYKHHQRCHQKDVWENYKGEIYLPPFAEGFVPRFLDRSIAPQSVIIFGLTTPSRPDRLKTEERLHRVRFVGSILFQYCSEISCVGKKGWSSRRLLVAVPVGSSSPLGDIVELEDLKNRVNWDEAMAYLQNYRGGLRLHQQTYPSYRVTAQNNSRVAMNLLVKEARVFNTPAQKKLLASCEKLYDYTWKALGLTLLAPQEISMKGSAVPISKVERKELQDNPEAKLLKENWPEFVEAFKKFHAKFGSRFNTCTRYAPYGDIRESRERFWFMTYMDVFFKLENMNHVYLCDRRNWVTNSYTSKTESHYDPQKIIADCSQDSLALAFEKGLSRFKNLAGTGRSYYRFIEYDSGLGGSHERLYSFVPENGKFPQCLQDIGKRETEALPTMNAYENIQVATDLFPKDVTWKGLIRYAKLPPRKVFQDNRSVDEQVRSIKPGVYNRTLEKKSKE